MVNSNRGRVAEAQKRSRVDDARLHLKCCIEVYRAQHESGRYFLHARRVTATSWNEQGVMVLADFDGVIRTRARMCRYGTIKMINAGAKFDKKFTSVLTKTPRIVRQMYQDCTRDPPHMVFQGRSRIEQAQMYLEQLCRAMCQRLTEQMVMGARGLFQIGAINFVDLDEMKRSIEQPNDLHEEDPWEQTWDDVSGKAFPPDLVIAAREEEIEFIGAMRAHGDAPIAQCIGSAGKQFTAVR